MDRIAGLPGVGPAQIFHRHAGAFQRGLGFFDLRLCAAMGQQKRQRTIEKDFHGADENKPAATGIILGQRCRKAGVDSSFKSKRNICLGQELAARCRSAKAARRGQTSSAVRSPRQKGFS